MKSLAATMAYKSVFARLGHCFTGFIILINAECPAPVGDKQDLPDVNIQARTYVWSNVRIVFFIIGSSAPFRLYYLISKAATSCGCCF
jgi:hypothetical protein